MKTSREIKTNINNISYYAIETEKLIKQQFDLDMAMPEMNSQVGSLRFDCLGAMSVACNHIRIYLDNMTANLEHAESQDKLLLTEEEEEDGI